MRAVPEIAPPADVVAPPPPDDPAKALAARDPLLGATLDDRYTILCQLGAGSMGTVYRARQHAMGRDVALKVLRSDHALDDSVRARFLREARATSSLASPHTVTVFDFGQAATGERYLAMELLQGEPLSARLARRGRLSVAEALDVARQALRSLVEAHAKGIVHRDLKPDNLFFAKITGQGADAEIVKVLDFGIAKLIGQANTEMGVVETQAGTVFGTPRYMSPEQAQGKALDARSDLYSLGVILYHLLTGRPPFIDEDTIVVMARHIKTPPPPMEVACPAALVPADVEGLVRRLLAKEPAMRPRSAEALAAELTHLVETGAALRTDASPPVAVDPPPDREPDAAVVPSARRTRAGWVVATIGIAALALALFSRPRPEAPSENPKLAPATAAAEASRSSVDPEGFIPTMSADELPRAPTAHASPHLPVRSGAPRPLPAGPRNRTSSGKSKAGYGYLE